jgi:hypothetical protein
LSAAVRLMHTRTIKSSIQQRSEYAIE